MAYQLSWLVPGRVIEVVISEYDMDTRESFDNEIKAMLDMAEQPVHILLDLRTMSITPSAQTAITMSYLAHPQMGRLLIVGLKENPALRFLSALVGRSSGIQIKDFSTPEEAQAFLRSVEKI